MVRDLRTRLMLGLGAKSRNSSLEGGCKALVSSLALVLRDRKVHRLLGAGVAVHDGDVPNGHGSVLRGTLGIPSHGMVPGA